MFKLLCMTNRKLCKGDFLSRIKEISDYDIPVILREKDLSEQEYTALAGQVLQICKNNCILHSFINSALELHAEKIHLPLPVFRMLENKQPFSVTGVSVHSVQEAKEAEASGASYLIAGHIFETDCKKNLPARGVAFLQEVCRSVNIPVYAIGGVSAQNLAEIQKAGASGACIMSGWMQCEKISEFWEELHEITT